MIGVIPSRVDTNANIFPISSIGTHTEINPLESDKEYIPNVSMIVPLCKFVKGNANNNCIFIEFDIKRN